MHAADSPQLDDLTIPWPELRSLLISLRQEYLIIRDTDPKRFARRLDRTLQRYPDYRVLTVQVFCSRRWFRETCQYVAILLPDAPPVESPDELQFVFGPVREI